MYDEQANISVLCVGFSYNMLGHNNEIIYDDNLLSIHSKTSILCSVFSIFYVLFVWSWPNGHTNKFPGVLNFSGFYTILGCPRKKVKLEFYCILNHQFSITYHQDIT